MNNQAETDIENTKSPGREPEQLQCDCCQREVDYVRGSMWHGQARICRDCFIEWYDPDRDISGEDSPDPRNIGNHIRKKHGLPPLPKAPTP